MNRLHIHEGIKSFIPYSYLSISVQIPVLVTVLKDCQGFSVGPRSDTTTE